MLYQSHAARNFAGTGRSSGPGALRIDQSRPVLFVKTSADVLQAILDLIRPQPVRLPLPPLRTYEPLRRGRYARRR
jgi:hypothetical protein